MRKLKLLLAACALFVGVSAGWAQTDVTATYLTNADFETTPIFDGTSLGSNSDPKSNATPTDGSVLLNGAKNVYQISGWTLMTTETSDFARTFTMPYETSLWVNGNNNIAGQQVTAPSNGSSVTENNSNVLFVEANWCPQALLGVKQIVNLPAGKYTLTFDTYVTTNLQYGTSRCGVSYADKSYYKWPAALNTWTNNEVTFTLSDATEVTISMGYLKNANQGVGNSPFLFVDNVKLSYTAVVVKDVLATALTAATNANAALGTLSSAIATAQAVYDNADATQNEVNEAAATLNAAVEQAMSAAGDASFLIPNLGFESCTVTTSNAAAAESAAPLDIAGDWTQTASAAWSSSAVVEYGGDGQVNGVNAPATDNAGNTGNALGVSVGWSGTVTYKSAAATLPAGVYTIKVNAYNALDGVTQFKSLFGFVPTSGSSSLSAKTSFTSGTWEVDEVTFTLNEATEGYIQVGGQAISGGSGSNAKVFFDNITIGYQSFLAGAKEAYDNAVASAGTAKTNSPNVTGTELAALNTELNKAEPTTVEGYNTAAESINNAKDVLIAAAPAYDALVAEIAYAKTIGVTTADDYAATSESTAASVVTSTQNLKVVEYTTINTAYPNDVTSLLGTWEKGNYDTTSGQGYTGNETYFNKWSSSATDLTSSATVTLPAGKYAVKVAGRGVSNTTMNLSVRVGDSDAVSTPFLMNGDSGKGIDTEGATNFEESGTYSNNNNGRGWQYRYITFETAGEDVTITISGHLNNGTWQSFYAPVLLCDEDTYAATQLVAAKAELQVAIDNAPAVLTTNVGTGVFQMPEAGVTTYSEAKTAAQAAHDAGDATLESIAAAKETFESAIGTYNALEINAPADGQLFNVILTYGGWTYDQKAMTYLAGDRADMGGYNIKYNAPANQNLAQAFTFTKVEGNNYKMSQIDADGIARYISTGVPYSGNTSQIRTTTNADDALLVTVIPTNTEGVWNLMNTEANNYIGSQDAGVFTVNSHIDFNIVETTKPSIAISTTAAGYGTTMLPFAVAELPSGVKAYTCAAIDGSTLTLVEVTALEANKPYIIEGAWENDNLTGDAQGTALTYTEGLLTGVYAQTDAPVGSYVLQNQESVVGFYKVAEGEGKQPTVKANHAYLNTASTARALYFNNATAIRAIEALTSGEVEIYNAAGARQNSLQKGVNIIKQGNKTFKVMVK